jgi:hypothetical protein
MDCPKGPLTQYGGFSLGPMFGSSLKHKLSRKIICLYAPLFVYSNSAVGRFEIGDYPIFDYPTLLSAIQKYGSFGIRGVDK